jgi:CHAD domain-containing protein
MAYRFEQHESVDVAVRRVAREQLDGALASIDSAQDDPGAAIHDVRKRTKKIRGLLRLVRPALGDDFAPENRWYRDTARALAPSRDAQVARETFEALVASCATGLTAEQAARLRSDLSASTTAAVSAEPAPAALGALRGALEEARDRVERWPLPREAGFETIADGLRRSYRAARRAFTAAHARPTAEALHDWRKRAKDHWYHARLLEACWPPVMTSWATEAHRLTELLGDDHDRVVLEQALADLPAGTDAPEALLAALAEERAALQAEALALGRRLHAEPPKPFLGRLSAYWHAWRSET